MSPRYQSGLLQPPSRLRIVGPSGRIIMPMGSQVSRTSHSSTGTTWWPSKGHPNSTIATDHCLLTISNSRYPNNQAMFAQQQ
ncbi:hypothetical protein DPMN_039652 [Dreissena polymorpha]|uniref:Uncharacterized protein n=1 Tax=Dreissena polymorpha TaxID=45954 RepID=A0A9D4CVC3_DREPO|nr:hypothetical protein DPMN_039652 [Dreissena polymorpha]